MRRPALLLTALALAVAGCGGDDSSDSGSGDSMGGGAPETTTVQAQPKGKADVEVSMKDIKFDPMDISVKRGQTVRWTNNDAVTHNVTKEKGPGPDFQSPNVDEGGTYQARFDTPGRIDYVCTIHPNQTGVVTVK